MAFARQALKGMLHQAVFQRVITEDDPASSRRLKWQGSAKETARVPPLLDSPQSAAPETFLSRDAVSAFPLLFGPLPQSLPGVRCRGWAALEQLPWRFCVNLSPPPSGRGDRPVLSPASDSQFRPPSAACSGFMRMSSGAAQRNENPRSGLSSSRARNRPDRQSRRRAAAGSSSPPLRRSSKTLRAPESPCSANSFNRSRAISSACGSRSIPQHAPRRQPPCNFNEMAACSDGRVEIRPLRPYTQPLQNFPEQHRRMQNAQN